MSSLADAVVLIVPVINVTSSISALSKFVNAFTLAKSKLPDTCKSCTKISFTSFETLPIDTSPKIPID